MGMYTELIFGAELKKDTPEDVIETLRFMLGEVDEEPINYPFPDGRHEYLLKSASSYFGVCVPVSRMWFDKCSKSWCISTRSSIKNYNNEIEEFLAWIKPHLKSGSGKREMYAITMYEADNEPIIYYLSDLGELN